MEREIVKSICSILSNLIANSDYKGYEENVEWAVKELQSLISQREKEAVKEFAGKLLERKRYMQSHADFDIEMVEVETIKELSEIGEEK